MNSFKILFRTHTWNETAQRNYEQLQKSTKHKIVIVYDNTNDPELTIYQRFPHLRDYDINFHSIQVFEKSGLYIPPHKALWKCGDYPLFRSILSNDLQFALMLEYDLFVSAEIDEHISVLLEERIDLCGKKIGNDNWVWKEKYDKYCAAAGIEINDIFGGVFFPFVWASNAMAKALQIERVNQKQIMSKFNLPHNLFPFCEVFTFQACKQGNLNFKSLQSLAHTDNLRWKENGVFGIGQLEDSKNVSGYVHPALTSMDYILSMIECKTEIPLKKIEDHIEKEIENMSELEVALIKRLFKSFQIRENVISKQIRSAFPAV